MPWLPAAYGPDSKSVALSLIRLVFRPFRSVFRRDLHFMFAFLVLPPSLPRSLPLSILLPREEQRKGEKETSPAPSTCCNATGTRVFMPR